MRLHLIEATDSETCRKAVDHVGPVISRTQNRPSTPPKGPGCGHPRVPQKQDNIRPSWTGLCFEGYREPLRGERKSFLQRLW